MYQEHEFMSKVIISRKSSYRIIAQAFSERSFVCAVVNRKIYIMRR